jgi:ATP-dependent 26S proteasome regulatory subunit
VLELGARYFHDDESAPLTVRTLPQVTRDRIVLPEGVLERIERQAFSIAEHADRLRASGRHLRRGLLLHGPPGTGKTLTAMYLAASMPGRTVVLLTGQSLGAVGASIDLATALQPAMVVLEDVDLVAMDRDFDEPTNAILFELLNGMDGLDEDHDVLFVLTTNRADLLEPALASRPGRIDQAVELPLPDAVGRRRLITLYGEGLDFAAADDRLIADLDGVSPAFIRELLRRAALLAAEETDGALRVTTEHLRRAYEELRSGADELTNTLLGAQPPPD